MHRVVTAVAFCLVLLCGISLLINTFSAPQRENNVNQSAYHYNPPRRRLLQEEDKVFARSFDKWDRSSVPFPCVSSDTPATQGIFYIKIPKTSSSTLAHITKRIAGREAKLRRSSIDDKIDICKTYDPEVHQKACDLGIGRRNRQKSFAWSVMRYPADRVISHYGMRVSHGLGDTKEGSVIAALKKPNYFPPHLEMSYLATKQVPYKLVEEEIDMYVESIITEYDFIGVYERLYESLVVMSMLIGAEPTDVLFDFLPSTHNRCGELRRPDWVTPAIEDYLTSDEWLERERGDYQLYKAVNKSLDMTIDMLGREKVEAKVEEYLKLLYIGTQFAFTARNKTGCGILNLHERLQPYNDIDQLPWFDRLDDDDKEFVQTVSSRSRAKK